MKEHTDSLDTTFATFFGEDDEAEEKCTDCDQSEGLTVLYTKQGGNSVWVCTDYRHKRDEAAKERKRQAAERIAEWNARDKWEEA